MGDLQMSHSFLESYFTKYQAGFESLYQLCKTETGTNRQRMTALFAAVHYVLDEGIPGDLIECGVWRGGSAMLMMGVLLSRGVIDRRIWLYDTYEGMTEPTERDVDFSGKQASQLLKAAEQFKENAGIWCYANLDTVTSNIGKVGYPLSRAELVIGPVEQTIPGKTPELVSLLRLDTDWYESTLHEMVHLYPKLVRGGVIIIDDYGHWQGCRQAIDQYFSNDLSPLELHRVDYTCRAALKKR
jgi:O-methyltransferase